MMEFKKETKKFFWWWLLLKSEKELFVKLLEKKKGSPKGKEEANQRKGTDKVWSKQNFTQENKKQTKRKFKTGSETNRRGKVKPF